MFARPRVPLPVLIVLTCAIGAVIYLNREVPPQRVAGTLATTPLEAPIADFSDMWSVAERVVSHRRHAFTLRTLVVEVPTDRGAPPKSMHLAFRSVSEEQEFYIAVNNIRLEMVISATFPTPPSPGGLAFPEPLEGGAVTVTLRRALAIADSIFAEAYPAAGEWEVRADVVLRTREGTPEWSVSYSRERASGSREGESGAERVATVVVNALDGSLLRGGGR